MPSPIFTAFHPHGSALALSAGDGRIKIWDATTGNLSHELADLGASSPVAPGHLAMDYTCMAWGVLPSNASAKKKKKGVKEKGAAAIVVVGTGSGDIIAWDTALGELKWRTSDCHAGSVKSLSFGKSGQRLYSVGNDGHVCEMDCTSGQVLFKFRGAKTPLTCVSIAEDGDSIAVASAEVKLFDISSKKRIGKFPGHPAPVKSLCFTPDGKYLLSSATGECHVVMWHVEGGKSEAAAPITLSVEHPAVAIGVSGFDKDDGDVRRVVAVTEGGVAYVWSASAVADLGNAKPTVIRVEHTGKGSKQGVLSARFVESEAAVLVAHGTSVKPHFEKVSLTGQEGLNIVLNAFTEGALLPAGAAAKESVTASAQVTLLGPDNAGEAPMPRPQVEVGSVKKKTKKRRAEAEDDEASQPSVKPSEEKVEETETALTVVPDDEPSLEEKLVALKIIEDVDAKDHNKGAKHFDRAVAPRADSLQVLLSQALRAEDNALIEQCLHVGDEKVITNTIKKMRPFEAAKFLAIAVSKMEGRPQRALSVVPWVRAILLQHASFVMTNLNMQPVLMSLYQIIETRLAVFRPLVSLSGRLDLIMAQIQKNEGKGEDGQQQNEAAVVYEEEDDEPEAIDVMVDGASQYDEGEEDEESESEDDAEEDDMGDEDEMDEDEPDIKLNGNGNTMSDGEDED